jgi:integrase
MASAITIEQLCAQYQSWAETYYRKPSGRPTRAANNIRDALRALTFMAQLPAEQMSPGALRQVQEQLDASGTLCRQTINERIRWIRRMYRWAAQRELVPDTLPSRLELVDALKRGRCTASDGPGVKPIDWDTVSETIAVAPLKLATMIELHWHTGMRPNELVQMGKSRIDRACDPWIYTPAEHKTEHHGLSRIIPLGQLCQGLLRAWWPRCGELLFEGDNHGRLTGEPMRPLSYCQAIRRLNERHGITPWRPNQIRHATATRLRKELGIEAARVILGHRSASTTEIYAEVDAERARRIMRDFG